MYSMNIVHIIRKFDITIRYTCLLSFVLLIMLPLSTSYIDCRISCRRCHENTEHPSVLEVYCAMCEECKQRRREKLISKPGQQSSPGSTRVVRKKPMMFPKVIQTRASQPSELHTPSEDHTQSEYHPPSEYHTPPPSEYRAQSQYRTIPQHRTPSGSHKLQVGRAAQVVPHAPHIIHDQEEAHDELAVPAQETQIANRPYKKQKGLRLHQGRPALKQKIGMRNEESCEEEALPVKQQYVQMPPPLQMPAAGIPMVAPPMLMPAPRIGMYQDCPSPPLCSESEEEITLREEEIPTPTTTTATTTTTTTTTTTKRPTTTKTPCVRKRIMPPPPAPVPQAPMMAPMMAPMAVMAPMMMGPMMMPCMPSYGQPCITHKSHAGDSFHLKSRYNKPVILDDPLSSSPAADTNTNSDYQFVYVGIPKNKARS